MTKPQEFDHERGLDQWALIADVCSHQAIILID
jgi:hypothetical protein